MGFPIFLELLLYGLFGGIAAKVATAPTIVSVVFALVALVDQMLSLLPLVSGEALTLKFVLAAALVAAGVAISVMRR